jgi:predicted nucleotidyltransferase
MSIVISTSESGKIFIMGELAIPEEQISRFCRQNHIRKLSLFGSALRRELGPDSDIDLLVEFDPEHIPGLLALARMERELSAIFGGRKIDLRTPEDLSRYFRRKVMETARVAYAS